MLGIASSINDTMIFVLAVFYQFILALPYLFISMDLVLTTVLFLVTLRQIGWQLLNRN